VRRSFAAQGIPLRHRTHAGRIVWFSNMPAFRAADLAVMVGPRTGKGSWGRQLEPYDERFGNFLVTYCGADQRLERRIDAAVSEFR
jgi:hypothetical protein